MNVPKHLDWTRANTVHLINLIKQNHSLWQVENKYYKHKRVRSTLLHAVATELSESMKCVVTPDAVMKKWHTLRSQYGREVKLLKESQTSGEVYSPRLWCFSVLTFLGGVDSLQASAMPFLGDGDSLQASTSKMEKQHRKVS